MPSEIFEVGVDWCTATAKPGPQRASLYLWGAELLRTREREHCKPERVAWQRYNGQYCGGVFLGDRPDGTVLRLSGDSAHRWYGRTVELADNVSRLDTQVTWRCEPPDNHVGARAWTQATTAAKAEGKPAKITRVEEFQGGFTLYLGARSSDRFARLYDKHQESKEDIYRGCWRFELELKQDQAKEAARLIQSSQSPGALITSTVHKFFSERGVMPPFDPTDQSPFRRVHVDTPDDIKRYEWLRDVVAPVADGLRSRGLGAEVDALFRDTRGDMGTA